MVFSMRFEILKDIYLVAGGRYNYTHPLNCNVYLIDGGKDQALIDSGAGLDSSIISSIQEHGFNPKNITLVINTHSHWDHARGNKDIKEISKCKIAIHELGADVLEKGPWPYNLKFDPVHVDLKLKDGDEIGVGPYKLQVIYTPGHTQDSICLLMRYGEKKVLFSGDTVQAWGSLGVTNAQTDFKVYKKSIERIASLKIDVLLPGHGIFILSKAYEHVDFLLEKISGVWDDFILFPHPLLSRLRSRWLTPKK
jgi:glyoxylase-like metal-dependent hydrolase (beta-lactamase superfamily II)